MPWGLLSGPAWGQHLGAPPVGAERWRPCGGGGVGRRLSAALAPPPPRSGDGEPLSLELGGTQGAVARPCPQGQSRWHF